MSNSRYIILFFTLFIFSCDEEELTFDNPLDVENNPNFIPPLTFLVNDIDGTTINESSIDIEIGGNQLISEIKYQIDDQEWTDWIEVDSNQTIEVELEYLDEGAHSLSYTGTYPLGVIEDTVHVANFNVDAVSNNGIRIFPEYSTMSTPNGYMEIILEEVENIAFGEIVFVLDRYPPSQPSAVCSDDIDSDICVYDLINTQFSDGIYFYKYKLSFGLSDDKTLSGTVKLGTIFSNYTPGTTGLTININIIEEESQLLDYQNNSIPISGVRGGTIVYD